MDTHLDIQQKIAQLKEEDPLSDQLLVYDEWLAALMPYQDVYALEFARASFERGDLHYKLGHFEAAVADLLVCAEILHYHFGPTDLRYAMALERLAECYEALGELEQAWEVLGQVMVIYEREMGASDLRILKALELQARLYIDTDKPSAALKLIGKVLGRPHTEHNCEVVNHWMSFLILAGEAHRMRDENTEAEQVYLKALSLYKEGPCDVLLRETSVGVYRALAELYLATGQLEHANHAAQKFLAFTREIYGEDSSDYVNALTLASRIDNEMTHDDDVSKWTRKAIDSAFDYIGEIQPEDLDAIPTLMEQDWHEDT